VDVNGVSHPATFRRNGNERLALAALIAYGGLNGRRLTPTSDEAHGPGDERPLRAPRHS